MGGAKRNTEMKQITATQVTPFWGKSLLKEKITNIVDQSCLPNVAAAKTLTHVSGLCEFL
jgi:hypothetical protein